MSPGGASIEVLFDDGSDLTAGTDVPGRSVLPKSSDSVESKCDVLLSERLLKSPSGLLGSKSGSEFRWLNASRLD